MRVERFLFADGKRAAKRSNIAEAPFFLVRASARRTDLPVAGEQLAG